MAYSRSQRRSPFLKFPVMDLKQGKRRRLRERCLKILLGSLRNDDADGNDDATKQ